MELDNMTAEVIAWKIMNETQSATNFCFDSSVKVGEPSYGHF